MGLGAHQLDLWESPPHGAAGVQADSPAWAGMRAENPSGVRAVAGAGESLAPAWALVEGVPPSDTARKEQRAAGLVGAGEPVPW